MLYQSTRGKAAPVSASRAIVQGLAEDGGLFVPETFPRLSPEEISCLLALDYRSRAAAVLGKYLTDYSASEIRHAVDAAYTGTFDDDNPAPLVEVKPGMHFLELWHGPTCAFKDLALQILPHLLTAGVRKTAPGQTTVILVATSGDTGKAALDGFADVPETKIIVFYPRDGVSEIQKLQMTSQRGGNVGVCAIHGNFDNAQNGVKAIFTDAAMAKRLSAAGYKFSSANSINFGRLAPQIVYYVSAYCDLVKQGKIAMGDTVNVAVPTGNFGNILAAVYARNMGIPIRRFICASNRNSVLSDFITTGTYDRNREFFTTISPSMDILISSNLERLLYMLHDGDAAQVASLMNDLKNQGRYQVSRDVLAKLQNMFTGGFCDDEMTCQTIARLYRENGYLADTHTAVCAGVYGKYVETSGDRTPCIIASTASPYKFAPAVLRAITGEENAGDDEFATIGRLAGVTGTRIPEPITGLRAAKAIHTQSIDKEAMGDFITKFLAV